MKRVMFAWFLVLFVAAGVAGQEKKDAGEVTTLKGYVVDQMCGKGMAKKPNPMEKAAGHTRDCALEDACSASGYGIFSDGKYVKFDAAGNKLAKEAIEKSKREKGLYFEVKGTVNGEMLAVSSVKEISPEKKAPTK
jgi:hypothetical protein